MADVGGIDYSQYANWKTITAPTGATYYIVPGTGYVYDPFLSAAKGRPVLFTNPTPQVEEKKKAQDEHDAAVSAAKKAASPAGQLLPIVGSIGGLAGAKYVGDWLSPSAAQAAAKAGTTAATTTATNAGGTLPQAGTWLGRQFDSLGNALGIGGGSPATTAGDAFTGAALPPPGSANFIGPMPEASGFSLSGIGSAGNYLLPAAGLLGAYDVFANGRTGARGALEGAASGAAMGSYFGPMGALIGGGIGLGAGLLNRWGDKDMWKTEGNKLKKLQENGTFVPQALIDSMPQNKGRSKEELVARAQASGGNVKFAEGRKESDLTPQDIVGYAAFAQKDPDWFKKPLQQQLAIAQQALGAGAVREHHGTIDVDWSKVPDVQNTPPPVAQNQPSAPVSRVGVISRPQGPVGESAGVVNTNSPLMSSMTPQTGGPLQYNPGLPNGNQITPQQGLNQWHPQQASPSPSQGFGNQFAFTQPEMQQGKQWQLQRPSSDSSKSEQTGKTLAKRMNDKSKKK